MIFYPVFYYKNVQSIDLDVLIGHNIKGIILDVDNTLIDYNKVMPKDIVKWVQSAKDKGFKMCILSNSNKKGKVSKVANDLQLDYLMYAQKPFKKGFLKALDLLKLPAQECVAVGDQIFTDVIGANRMHIYSLYVEPINKKEYWYTAWKRPIEAIVIKKYLNKCNRKELS